MGLNLAQRLLASRFDAEECYGAIVEYIRGYRPDWRRQLDEAHQKGVVSKRDLVRGEFSFSLSSSLPAPAQANAEDMDYVAVQVILGKLEGFYQDVDRQGVKLGAYAHRYIETRCGSDSPCDEVQASLTRSELYSRFGMYYELLD